MKTAQHSNTKWSQVMLCYLLSFKEFILAGIMQPPEVSIFFFLSLCLFLSVCFYAVRSIWLKATQMIFKKTLITGKDIIQSGNLMKMEFLNNSLIPTLWGGDLLPSGMIACSIPELFSMPKGISSGMKGISTILTFTMIP